MATHRSILASRIPWTEEPGELQFMRVTKSWTQLKLLSMHASKWATVCSWPAFHPQLSQYLQLKGRGKSVDEQGESLELHHNLRLQDGTGLGKRKDAGKATSICVLRSWIKGHCCQTLRGILEVRLEQSFSGGFLCSLLQKGSQERLVGE